MTVTIPTLVWVLPLTLAVLLAWAWAWRRWVTPRVRDFVINEALIALQDKAGLSRDDALERIEAWKGEGWPG